MPLFSLPPPTHFCFHTHRAMAAAAGMGLPSGRGSSRTKGLDCPICFEAYGSSSHVPMVLSCGHTLCEECVEKNRRGADKVWGADQKHGSSQ